MRIKNDNYRNNCVIIYYIFVTIKICYFSTEGLRI